MQSEPIRVGNTWVFADGTKLPVVSGGDGPLALKTRGGELQEQIDSFLKAAREIAAKAEGEHRDFTPDERTMVTKALEDARKVKNQLLEVNGDAAMIEELNALGQPVGQVAKAAGGRADNRKSLGQALTDAPDWLEWRKTINPAITSDFGRIGNSPVVPFDSKSFIGGQGAKALLTGGSDTSGGALVDTQWLGLLDTGTFMRPLTIRDLVTKGQTGSDAVEYARVTGFTNAAATVAEATTDALPTSVDAGGALVQNAGGGYKPKSSMVLEKVVDTVKTIAHWLPATKRALSDAGQLRTLIDTFLNYGLEEELEDQILTGNATGENFDGIMHVSGTQAQAWDTNLLVTTRKAKTKVRTVGRARPTAYVFNPEDNERIDLLRDDSGGAGTGAFLFGSPAGNQQQTLWGLPRIESEGVPAGSGVVADWRQAVLWDREQAGIQVTDSHADFFVRNLIAILAELRAAFGVIRPSAFVIMDLTA
jgi:HK97 family phage major capsid protein